MNHAVTVGEYCLITQNAHSVIEQSNLFVLHVVLELSNNSIAFVFRVKVLEIMVWWKLNLKPLF